MNVKQLRNCLRLVIKSVTIYKKEDFSQSLKEAEANLKESMENETVTDEEADEAYEHFDRASEMWFKAFNNLQDSAEMLFDEFASINGNDIKLKHNKLWKALDKLPSSEAKHLLVLAIKYQGLGQQSMSDVYRALSRLEEDPTLDEISKQLPRTSISPKMSRKQTLHEKEDITLQKIYEVSTKLNPKTLQLL